MAQTRGPEEIDALFEHMIKDLDHNPEDEMDWHFMLASSDRERLESIGASLEHEFMVQIVETTHIDENGKELVGDPCLMVIAQGALTPDEVKTFDARFSAFAEDEGVEYDGVGCYDAMTDEVMEAMFGWLDVDDADWRLRHFTDMGLEPEAAMDWEFAFEAETRTAVWALADSLVQTGHRTDGPIEDEDGLFLTAKFRGVNNGEKLRDHFMNVKQAASIAGVELLGVQFPEDENE